MPQRIRAYSEKPARQYQVRMRDVDQEIGDLSSGNQQKVVVGRELAREPKFADAFANASTFGHLCD